MTAATVAHATTRPQSASPCAHGPWAYAGPALTAGGAPMPRPGSGCEAPAMLVCLACGLTASVDCKTTRASKCSPCALRYRHRVQRVARVQGGVLLWTLTAPGRRAHSVKTAAGWRPCPCTAKGGTDLARWNAGAAMAFSRLLNNGIRRDARFAWLRGAYLRAVETQARGALHFHVLVRVEPGAVIPPGALDALTELVMAYGFGHECDVQEVEPGRGAHYVAKYVGKAADQRLSVPWAKDKARALQATPVPVPTHDAVALSETGKDRMTSARWLDEQVVTWVSRTPTYRSWSASRDWPNTMRALLAAQEHFAALLAALPTWDDGPIPEDVPSWIALPPRPDLPPLP